MAQVPVVPWFHIPLIYLMIHMYETFCRRIFVYCDLVGLFYKQHLAWGRDPSSVVLPERPSLFLVGVFFKPNLGSKNVGFHTLYRL